MLRLLPFAVIILFYDTFRAPYLFFIFCSLVGVVLTISKPDLLLHPHSDLKSERKKIRHLASGS